MVASDARATPEILSSVDPGLLTPPEPGPLADAIGRLLGGPARRAELGARGLESVRSRFTWEGCVAGLDAVYKELCGDAARR